MGDLQVIYVPLALMAGAFAVLGVDLLFKKGAPRDLREYIAYASVIGAFALVVLRVWNFSSDQSGFSNAVALDGLALFLMVSILVATGLSLMLASNLSDRFHVAHAEYLALSLFASSGMILLAMSTEIVTMFLSLEIMSLSIYVLTGATRDVRSTEASVKYFIMGSAASAFLAYGMVLLYGITGSVYIPEIGAKISSGEAGGTALVGLGLMLIGFAFKVGAVPFHMWVPDVYEGAPTAVTSFMSVAVKAAGFGALIRVVSQLKLPMGSEAAEVLEVIAIATMLIGNVFAMAQSSVKRMLAYSSVAHTGYALIGVVVAAGSTRADRLDGIQATTFYLLAYTFMTLGAFASLVFAGSKDRDAESLEDFQGLAHTRPMAALLMSVFMLSLAGLPPFGGFVGKFLLFKSALGAHYTWLVVAAVVATLLSVYYYVRVVVVMYMKPAPERGPMPLADWSVGAALIVAAGFTLVLGIVPGDFIKLAGSLVQRLATP